MSKRAATRILVTVAALALLAVWGVGAAMSASAKKKKVVPIVMKEPGCHWFKVHGKTTKKLAVHGKTGFRNLDEAALIFKSKHFKRRLAVGKTLWIKKKGVYHITMVKQAPDDNHLRLVVR